MRILLINPPYLAGFHQFSLNFPPLGPAYLAAVLREEGHHVSLLDMNVSRLESSAAFDGFELIGLSTDTPRYPRAVSIAAQAKNRGVPVAMGGPHVSFQAEETLTSGSADYVIRGEGEQAMLSLAEHLEGHRDLSDVPGLSYRSNDQVIHNAFGGYINDVDSLPFPARDLLPMDKYPVKLGGLPSTSVISSRGCPFHCSFCASSELFGLKWRPRSPEALLQEVKELKRRYGLGGIYFMDDNFTLDPDRTIRFCELLKKEQLELTWFCFSRINTILEREDMVESMAQAGARMIFLGVETPNQEALESYGKKLSAEASVQAVERLRKHGIRPMCSFILGDPSEDKGMMRRTIDFSRQLDPELAQFSLLTPYPGTRLFEEVKDRQLNREWSYYDGLHATIQIDEIQPSELERLLKKAYVSFYLNPKRIFKRPVESARYLLSIKHLFNDSLAFGGT